MITRISSFSTFITRGKYDIIRSTASVSSSSLFFTTSSSSNNINKNKFTSIRRTKKKLNIDTLLQREYPKEWANYMQQKQIYEESQAEVATQKTEFEKLNFPTKGKDLADLPQRCRFAPSPTGSLHVGGARTALYNYLLGKQSQRDEEGSTATSSDENHPGFLLRIEDTDLARSTKESEESVLKDLEWLGLIWDEGPDMVLTENRNYGPYRQSERSEIYKIIANQFIEDGLAYKCFCTKEELDEMKRVQEENGETPRYNGKWRDATEEEIQAKLDEGAEYTVRFKVPPNTRIVIDDAVRGVVSWDAEQTVGDFILLRSSGVPVYNFCVAVDDALMGVTTVIRAEEHLTNTLRQCLILDALGVPRPKYAHSSLILGTDKQKLSKRHGATSCNQFRLEGYLPVAMMNYLALLGWNEGTGDEIYSKDELIESFSLDRLVKSPAVFDLDKLKWINSQHIKQTSLYELLPMVLEQFHLKDIFPKSLKLPKITIQNEDLFEEEVEPSEQSKKLDQLMYAATSLLLDRIETTQDVVQNTKELLSYNLPSSFEELKNEEAKNMIERGYFYDVASHLLQAYKDKTLPIPNNEHLLDAFLDPNQEHNYKFGPIPPETETTYSYAKDYKTFMKLISKEKKIKGQNLFHPVRYALTGEMSGQDVTKQLSVLQMIELWGEELEFKNVDVVTLEDRFKTLEAFLETIPQEYRAPVILEEKEQKTAAATETEKPQAASAQVATIPQDSPVSIYSGPPFTAVDIRVGYIKNAFVHPEAEKLYVEEIDVGEAEPRTICSGLRPYIDSEQDLIGKKVVVLCNLKARTMLGVNSHGMVLCASNEDHSVVKLLHPPSEAKVGERVGLPSSYYSTLSADEASGEPFAENKMGKKKVWDKIQPMLSTDEETGTALFLDTFPLLTSEGVCTSSIRKGNIS